MEETTMKRSLFATAVLMNVFGPRVAAQSTNTSVTFNFNLADFGSGVPGSVTATATGALGPFGPNQSVQIWGGQYGFGSNSGGFTFIFTLANTDILSFSDLTSAISTDDSATGTATLKYGTGLFNGATGSFTYSFACTAGCYSGSGTPVPGTFGFSFTGNGSLTLPPAAAGYSNITNNTTATPNGSLPTGFTKYVINPILNLMFGGNNSNSGGGVGGDGNMRLTSSESSATGGGSINITPPWQTVSSSYSAAATCPNVPTGCWIAIPDASGSIPAFSNTVITADINPGNLGPGVYPAEPGRTALPWWQARIVR